MNLQDFLKYYFNSFMYKSLNKFGKFSYTTSFSQNFLMYLFNLFKDNPNDITQMYVIKPKYLTREMASLALFGVFL